MATVAIVAHSQAGHTWRLAEAVCDGAHTADAQVHRIRIDEEGIVDEAGWDMLAVADGIIFGCPTHMGGPSWQFKRFADTTIRVCRQRHGDAQEVAQNLLQHAVEHGARGVQLLDRRAS